MEPRAEYLSYDKIINDCKEAGIEITWRTLNYYKSLGLLPGPTRMKGDKKGYYPREIVNDLMLYYFLQKNVGFTLRQIKKLRDDFQIFDKYIDPKKATAYWGNFNYIISATYKSYAEVLSNDPYAKEHYKWFAIIETIMKNRQYRPYISSFRETILPSILKEGVTKENFDKHIKEWGRNVARTLIEEMKESDAESKAINELIKK